MTAIKNKASIKVFDSFEKLKENPEEKGVKLPNSRKEKIQMMKALKMNVNFKLMTLDKEDKDFEETQIELLSQLNGIETQLVKIKKNKNESKFFEFKTNGAINRKQRRSA